MAQTAELSADTHHRSPVAVFYGYHCDPSVGPRRYDQEASQHERCAGWWPELSMGDSTQGFNCDCSCHHAATDPAAG